MFFLLEGEVELVVDVPLTQDKDTLLANLLQMVGRDPSVGLGPRARSVAGVEGALDGSGGDLSPPVMAGKRYRRIRWTGLWCVCNNYWCLQANLACCPVTIVCLQRMQTWRRGCRADAAGRLGEARTRCHSW